MSDTIATAAIATLRKALTEVEPDYKGIAGLLRAVKHRAFPIEPAFKEEVADWIGYQVSQSGGTSKALENLSTIANLLESIPTADSPEELELLARLEKLSDFAVGRALYEKDHAQFSRDDLTAEAWRRGVLWWKLRPGQLEVYRFLERTEERHVTLVWHRGAGKSFFSTLYLLEGGQRHAGVSSKYFCPTIDMATEIAYPIIEQLSQDCPAKYRPSLKPSTGRVEHWNGSLLTVKGTEQGGADRTRGTTNFRVGFDEEGFMSNPDYVFRSAVGPRMVYGGKVIHTSTVPITIGHPFVRRIKAAQANGGKGLYSLKASENPDLSPEYLEQLIEDCGGPGSTAVRRELENELIVDKELALFPDLIDLEEGELLSPVSEAPTVGFLYSDRSKLTLTTGLADDAGMYVVTDSFTLPLQADPGDFIPKDLLVYCNSGQWVELLRGKGYAMVEAPLQPDFLQPGLSRIRVALKEGELFLSSDELERDIITGVWERSFRFPENDGYGTRFDRVRCLAALFPYLTASSLDDEAEALGAIVGGGTL